MSLLASICRPNGDTGSGECRWASEEAIWTILKANWTQEVRALPAELDACAHTDGAPMRGKSLICQVSSSRLQMSTLRLQSTQINPVRAVSLDCGESVDSCVSGVVKRRSGANNSGCPTRVCNGKLRILPGNISCEMGRFDEGDGHTHEKDDEPRL